MAKKKNEVSFDKLKDLNLSSEPDIEAIKEAAEEPKAPKNRVGRPAKEKGETIKTSYRYEKAVHLALKRYCLDEDMVMGEFVFDNMMKEFLIKKGYYPPNKR